MCGIAGVTGRGVQNEAGLKESLRRLAHRGPDSFGQQRLESRGQSLWFGATRLAILDLSPAGHQPMASRDGRWWVTFNGEIYNHLDLRKQLNLDWRGHSDTETLVECIAAWGLEGTLSRLNGMFAFGALDVAAGRLYLARDPFGVKPLYYSLSNGGGLAFSSEIKSLLPLVDKPPQKLDVQAFRAFLTIRFVPSPSTLLEGIKRLPPGHFLMRELGTGHDDLQCYARYPSERFRGTLDDAVEAYYALLSQAVKRQLLSDVPLGVFLSGGVDSGLVAALAAEQVGKLPCYTVGFGPGHDECELADAAHTAAVLGLEHHPVTVTAEDLWNAFENCVAAVEEPLGTTSVLLMWHLAQRARKDVTVVLTGQGSDEPWGGYCRYQAELWRDRIPFPSLLALLGPVLRHLPGVPEFLDRAAASIPVADRAQRFEQTYALFFPSMRRQLTGTSESGCAADAIRYWLNWVGSTCTSGVEAMMAIDTRMGLADDLLLYGDKISMAHSLEARVPMLDIEVVRFVESLPIEYRVRLSSGKIAHKLAAARHLAPAIVNRPKKAFMSPFGAWAATVWKERIADVLLSPSASHWAWLNRQAVQGLWREHVNGKRDRSRQLFALTSFCLWSRQTGVS
jgi:asparagine synthase (glutamine-hydrolysing)